MPPRPFVTVTVPSVTEPLTLTVPCIPCVVLAVPPIIKGVVPNDDSESVPPVVPEPTESNLIDPFTSKLPLKEALVKPVTVKFRLPPFPLVVDTSMPLRFASIKSGFVTIMVPPSPLVVPPFALSL